jgi:predicted MFS family arabinose efflux permease
VSTPQGRSGPRLLVPSLMFIALVVAAVGSLGAPLITSVATTFRVSLDSAQWTLTITLLSGAVATPVLGRLGAGPHRRRTVLATLAIVVAGSVLTVCPLPFAWLLAGRAAQGVGLGLTALMMGVARDHLPEGRSAPAIALVSVASTIGIGVGYPVAGLLTDLGGVRAAYGLGLFVTAIAFLAAWRSVPAAPEGRSARVDITGAFLLAGGLFLVLFLASETSLWSQHLALAAVLAAAAVLLLCAWTGAELRSKSPLVDVRAVRHRAVAGANIAMLVGGAGMYLLLTLITRYAQTPLSAGYGFGLTTFIAGLVLVPFSVLGFVAGKLTPRVRERIGAPLLLAGSAVVVFSAFALFAAARSNLAELFVAMGVLGFGVGSFSAAMPGVILAVTPKSQTSSAMSFNQVVRSVGFSLGSAISGLVLAAGTGTGHLFPANSAYTTAALAGIAAMTVTAIASLALARQRAPGTKPATAPAGAQSQVDRADDRRAGQTTAHEGTH